jgi:hypothetical protein
MNAAATRSKLTDIVLGLQQVDLAIAGNVHKIVPLGNSALRVIWATDASNSGLYDVPDGSFAQYLRALRERQFSAVLNDGSLIQMSYDFRRDDLVCHRLAFLPSPIVFSVEELDELAIDDFIELCSREDLYERTRTRPYLRFDFNADCPEQEPYSHVHTCFPESRLPVCGPISVTQFIEFIFGTFYPEIWKKEHWLSSAVTECLPHQIRDEHRRRLHLSATQVVIEPRALKKWGI